MFSRFFVTCLTFIFGLLIAFSPLAAQAQHRINIATGNGFKPFTDVGLPEGGMASQIVKEAFKLSGWDVTYYWLPWKRGYEMARQMHLDAAVPWGHRADTTNAFTYSDPLFTIEHQVWSKPHKNIQTTADLEGKTGCRPIGYPIPIDHKSMHDAGQYKLVRPQSMVACFRMLANEYVDFIICNRDQGQSILSTNEFQGSEIKSVLQSEKPVEMHLVMSKFHPLQAKILFEFNKGLKALKAKGRYAEIVGKY